MSIPFLSQTPSYLSKDNYLIDFKKNYGQVHITKFTIFTIFKYTD